MKFLETSVLIRYFTGDDPHKADRAENLFRQTKAGRVKLYLTHFVIAEAVWVLSKTYEFQKGAIAHGLKRLLNTPNIFCDEAPTLLAAVDLFESKNISFIDAYHAVFLPARGITEFYSYDIDFDQVAGITRKEP